MKHLTTTTALTAALWALVPACASADMPKPLDIPAQPLPAAIGELSAETGQPILARTELLQDHISPAIHGPLTTKAALNAMLEGSGLEARELADASLIVTRAAVSQAADEMLELEPIIISGELIERTLLDSPTSVSITTGEELESRGDPSVYNAIERAANVSAPLGGKGFSIRGIDQRGFGAGSGLLVSTQVDGIALPDNQATFLGAYSSWDLQQVEVLRGPQSTQQGRNALAGAVVIRSNDPTYDRELKLRGEIGSRDTLGGALMANIPLIDQQLAFRFSADHFQTDGWVDNPVRDEDDYDARERTTYRAKLRWDPSDRVETILSYTYSDNKVGEDLVLDDRFPPKRENRSNDAAEESIESQIWGLRINADLTDTLRLESETSYYTDDYLRLEDIDGEEGDALLRVWGDAESFEQDLRLRFDTAYAQGVVGLFYTKNKHNRPNSFTAAANRFLPSIIAGFIPDDVTISRIGDSSMETENFAVFGEADIEADVILSGLSFTLGARYDRETVRNSITDIRTASDDLLSYLPPPLQPIAGPPLDAFLAGTPGYDTKATFDAFLPKLGVNYDWNPDVSTSFTIQRGYRAGGAQQNVATGQINEYDPEYTWNYELAFRGSFYQDRLRSFVNIFYTDWTDQQVSVLGDSGDSLDENTVNAGKSEMWGGELTLEMAATNNLDLFATIGYVETKILEFDNNGVDYAGNEFPGAPKWTGGLGGTYYFDNGISLGLDASYTAGSYFDVDNDPRYKSDDRWLVNARAAYEWNGLTATAYVRNLFDNEYAVTRRPRDQGISAVTGEPLTVGMVLQWDY